MRRDFDVSTLEHWYNDDGSLRKSYDPSSAARRRKTAEAAAMAADPAAAAADAAANGRGVNGSPAQAKAKKRALVLDDSEDAEELDERALAPEKKKKKKKEKEDRVQRSTSGDPLPFTSSADNLQPGARPPPVVFGDTGPSTNGSASNTPAFGRAGAGTPAQPRVATAAQPQPQATPAPPAGPSAKQAKYAQRMGLPTGGLASSSALAASTTKGAQASSAAPPAKRQPQPQSRLKRTGKFDDAGRPIWEKIDSPPPAAATTTAMPDQVLDELSWGTVEFEEEETLSVIRQKEAARAHQQQQQQAQPQRLYGAAAAPPNLFPAYDTSSQYSALADTPAVAAASTSAAETQIKPDPDAIERQEASGLAAVRPDEARRDDEVFAVLQRKRASSREASKRPPAALANERDRESSYRWDAPPRSDYRDDSRYDRSASRDAYSAAPVRPFAFTSCQDSPTDSTALVAPSLAVAPAWTFHEQRVERHPPSPGLPPPRPRSPASWLTLALPADVGRRLQRCGPFLERLRRSSLEQLRQSGEPLRRTLLVFLLQRLPPFADFHSFRLERHERLGSARRAFAAAE